MDDDAAVDDDAGVDAGDDVVQPEEPAPAAPPSWTSCPSGWREVRIGTDPATCEPWPEAGRQECSGDEAHFPGAPGCERVGPPCAADGWPADVPDDVPVLWVRAGSEPGDGARKTPFATIGAALAAAGPDTVIAIASGSYDEALLIDQPGLVLLGACVSGTRLTASTPSEDEGTVRVQAAGVEMSNLSVSGARPGIDVVASGSLHLTNALVTQTVRYGVGVVGGSLSAESLAVRDISPLPSDRTRGRGLSFFEGAHVDLVRASVERTYDCGIVIDGAGTVVAVADTSVYDTAADAATGGFGRGLAAQSGAQVTVERSVFERGRDFGVWGGLEGTLLALSDVVIRDGQGQESDGDNGVGLVAILGGRVEVARAVVENNRTFGMLAANGGTLVLEDVVVRDTDVNLRDTIWGRGIEVEMGGHLEASRTLLSRNRDAGIVSAGFEANDGTSVVATDLTVTDTEDGGAGWGGVGVFAQPASRMELTRALFERNIGSAILASGVDASVVLSDVTARDTRGRSADGFFGRAIEAGFGVSVDITRATFDQNHETSVFIWDAVARLQDVVIRNTLPQECSTSTCPSYPAGHGLASGGGAEVTMSRFRVEGSSLCGLMLIEGGSIDAQDGLIADNEIGACIKVPGYSIERLAEGVEFRDNGADVESQATDIPSPGPIPR